MARPSSQCQAVLEQRLHRAPPLVSQGYGRPLTGSAVVPQAIALRAQGAQAAVVVSAIDRSEKAGGPLTDVDIETRAVLTRVQLAAY